MVARFIIPAPVGANGEAGDSTDYGPNPSRRGLGGANQPSRPEQTRSGPPVLPYTVSLWSPMRLFSVVIFSSAVLLSGLSTSVGSAPEKLPGAQSIFGFRDATAERAAEVRFLARPDAKLAD